MQMEDAASWPSSPAGRFSKQEEEATKVMNVLLSIADRIEAMDHALTARELARMLSCSIGALYTGARAGRIPHLRIAGSIRFDPTLTAQWVRSSVVGL
jgi:hypothetical protein